MNNPYDLHSWSKHYRQEVIREVQTARSYARRPREGVRPPVGRATRIWLSILSLLGRRELVE